MRMFMFNNDAIILYKISEKQTSKLEREIIKNY